MDPNTVPWAMQLPGSGASPNTMDFGAVAPNLLYGDAPLGHTPMYQNVAAQAGQFFGMLPQGQIRRNLTGPSQTAYDERYQREFLDPLRGAARSDYNAFTGGQVMSNVADAAGRMGFFDNTGSAKDQFRNAGAWVNQLSGGSVADNQFVRAIMGGGYQAGLGMVDRAHMGVGLNAGEVLNPYNADQMVAMQAQGTAYSRTLFEGMYHKRDDGSMTLLQNRDVTGGFDTGQVMTLAENLAQSNYTQIDPETGEMIAMRADTSQLTDPDEIQAATSAHAERALEKLVRPLTDMAKSVAKVAGTDDLGEAMQELEHLAGKPFTQLDPIEVANSMDILAERAKLLGRSSKEMLRGAQVINQGLRDATSYQVGGSGRQVGGMDTMQSGLELAAIAGNISRQTGRDYDTVVAEVGYFAGQVGTSRNAAVQTAMMGVIESGELDAAVQRGELTREEADTLGSQGLRTDRDGQRALEKIKARTGIDIQGRANDPGRLREIQAGLSEGAKDEINGSLYRNAGRQVSLQYMEEAGRTSRTLSGNTAKRLGIDMTDEALRESSRAQVLGSMYNDQAHKLDAQLAAPGLAPEARQELQDKRMELDDKATHLKKHGITNHIAEMRSSNNISDAVIANVNNTAESLMLVSAAEADTSLSDRDRMVAQSVGRAGVMSGLNADMLAGRGVTASRSVLDAQVALQLRAAERLAGEGDGSAARAALTKAASLTQSSDGTALTGYGKELAYMAANSTDVTKDEFVEGIKDMRLNQIEANIAPFADGVALTDLSEEEQVMTLKHLQVGASNAWDTVKGKLAPGSVDTLEAYERAEDAKDAYDELALINANKVGLSEQERASKIQRMGMAERTTAAMEGLITPAEWFGIDADDEASRDILENSKKGWGDYNLDKAQKLSPADAKALLDTATKLEDEGADGAKAVKAYRDYAQTGELGGAMEQVGEGDEGSSGFLDTLRPAALMRKIGKAATLSRAGGEPGTGEGAGGQANVQTVRIDGVLEIELDGQRGRAVNRD